MRKLGYFFAFILVAISSLFITNINTTVYADETSTVSPVLFRPDQNVDYTLIDDFNLITKLDNTMYYTTTGLELHSINLSTKVHEQISLPSNEDVSQENIIKLASGHTYIYALTTSRLIVVNPSDKLCYVVKNDNYNESTNSAIFDMMDIYKDSSYIMLTLASTSTSRIECYKITNENVASLPTPLWSSSNAIQGGLSSIASTKYGYIYLFNGSLLKNVSIIEYTGANDTAEKSIQLTTYENETTYIFSSIHYLRSNNTDYLVKEYNTSLNTTDVSISSFSASSENNNLDSINTNLATISSPNLDNGYFTAGKVNKFSHIEISDNDILVYDNSTKSGQSFTFEQSDNTITYSSTLFASLGSDKNRYVDISNMQYSNNALYLVDNAINTIQVIANNETKKFQVSDSIIASSELQGVLFALTEQNSTSVLLGYDLLNTTEGNATTVLNFAYDSIKPIDLIEYTGDLYLLGTKDNITQIYKTEITYSNNEYSVISSPIATIDYLVSEGSRLSISEDETNIYFNIFDISKVVSFTKTKGSTTVSLTYTETNLQDSAIASDIALDFEGNAYILSNTHSLLKYTLENGRYVHTSTFTIPSTYNFSTLTIENITGTLYLYDTLSYTISCIQNTQLFKGLDEVSTITTAGDTLRDSVVTTISSASQVEISRYPYGYGDIVTMNISKAYVLELFNDRYYGIVYSADQKDYIGYVDKTQVIVGSIESEDKSYSVITKTSNIYLLPLLSSSKVAEVSKNNILSTNYEPITGIDGRTYIAVSYSNKIGYMLKSDLTSSTSNSITPFHQKNANILCGNEEYVYVYDNLDADTTLPSEVRLSNNTRVYAEDYLSSSDMTKIYYITSDNVEHIGYIETKYIKKDNDYKNLYIALGLILGAVVIMGNAIWVYITISKKKKEEYEY